MTLNLNVNYIFFFLGTLLMLFYKWRSYVLYGEKKGNTKVQSTNEWFFEPSRDNAASWTATLAFSWAVSYVYVERITFPYLNGLTILPLHPSVALLLGVFTERLAPNFIKWLLVKVLP